MGNGKANGGDGKHVVQNDGFCACCRSNTVFRSPEQWLRDFYVCTKCGSVPRQRHIQTVLDSRFPGWEQLVIHESSPSNDFISRYASQYSASQYFPDVPRGETAANGVRSEDVENLTFGDESIDIFITQDVLEHVFRPERAIAEIHRVLKPGGAHVFTAPKHKGLLETVQRAALNSDGTIEYLLPEEYHGNPIGDNKALVTYDYGYDFEQLMSTWAGTSVEVFHTLDRSRGLDAEFNEVYVIVKPGGAPVPPRVSPHSLYWSARDFARRAERKARRVVGERIRARRS
jgi:SAM-dependent methyltransferase